MKNKVWKVSLANCINMGKYTSLEEASRSIEPTDTYSPEIINHKTYLKYFEILKD